MQWQFSPSWYKPWTWLPYYSSDLNSYYGNAQPGDFLYRETVFCIGPIQFRWLGMP